MGQARWRRADADIPGLCWSSEHPFAPVGDRAYAAAVGEGDDDQYAGLVAVRRRGVTLWAERRPSHCPAGHRLAPGRVQVAWLTCRCQHPALGHRTWLCRYVVNGQECGLITFSPPHLPLL